MQELKRVYVWEFPIRLTHWVNFLCIIALSITGFYIASPFAHGYSTNQYIMGWMRFIHFVSAYAFLMSLIIRVYWAFMGSRYASWKVWFPFTGERLRELIGDFKFYTLISRKHAHVVGHTVTAGLTYFFVFLLFAFEIVSGFAIYSLTHKGFIWPFLGGWLLSVWSIPTIRLLHHLSMYLIFVFIGMHLYIAWWLDSTEKNGVMGSIFSGYKFVAGKE